MLMIGFELLGHYVSGCPRMAGTSGFQNQWSMLPNVSVLKLDPH